MRWFRNCRTGLLRLSLGHTTILIKSGGPKSGLGIGRRHGIQYFARYSLPVEDSATSFHNFLRQMFLAVESGKRYEETTTSVQSAAEEWAKEREGSRAILRLHRLASSFDRLFRDRDRYWPCHGDGKSDHDHRRRRSSPRDQQHYRGTRDEVLHHAGGPRLHDSLWIRGPRLSRVEIGASVVHEASRLRYLRTRIRFNTADAPQPEPKRRSRVRNSTCRSISEFSGD